MKQDHPSLPMEKRFVTGRVISVASDIIHFAIIETHPFAQNARVRFDDEQKKTSNQFQIGQQYPLFLLQPSQGDSSLWIASLSWAKKEDNPWIVDAPSIKSEVNGTAICFVGDSGVIVRLENGIDAYLHQSRLPEGGEDDIAKTIHIGDHIQALVEFKDLSRLEISLNVRSLLQLRERQEELRRRNLLPPDEDNPTQLMVTPKPARMVPLGTQLLVIDADKEFGLALKGWVDVLGGRGEFATTLEEAQRRFSPNNTTHIIASLDWPDETIQQNILLWIQSVSIAKILITANLDTRKSISLSLPISIIMKPMNDQILYSWFDEQDLLKFTYIYMIKTINYYGEVKGWSNQSNNKNNTY
ncbi:MAG: S1 RNA-binding domain-containing protein [Magnetococcus sp. YQC-5]